MLPQEENQADLGEWSVPIFLDQKLENTNQNLLCSREASDLDCATRYIRSTWSHILCFGPMPFLADEVQLRKNVGHFLLVNILKDFFRLKK